MGNQGKHIEWSEGEVCDSNKAGVMDNMHNQKNEQMNNQETNQTKLAKVK